MLLRYFVSFTILISNLLSGQIDLSNQILIEPSGNYLYISLENIIQIVGTEDTSLVLKSSNSSIDYKSKNLFNLEPNWKTGIFTDTLKVFKEGERIFTKIYEIKMIENPNIKLGIIADSTCTLKELRNNNILETYLENSKLKFNAQVINYEIDIIKMNGDTIQLGQFIGNKINKKTMRKLMKLKPGETLIFPSLVVRGPEVCPRSFSLKLRIK
jgi:hypothetical protein